MYPATLPFCELTSFVFLAESFPQNDTMFNIAFDPNFPFGSEAANLEYTILSAILGNPSPTTESEPTPPQYSTWPSTDALPYAQSPSTSADPRSYRASYGETQGSIQPMAITLSASPTNSPTYLSYSYQQSQPQQAQEQGGELQYTQYESSADELHPLQPRYPLDSRPRSPPHSVYINPGDVSSRGILSPPNSQPSPTSTSSFTQGPPDSFSQLQSINDRVTTPYDYTEGYHFLMKHLPSRCVVT